LIQFRDLADHASRFIENRLLEVKQKREIDLRKRAEKKLAKSSKVLERVEAETRAMLNAIPIYIARVSKDFQYLFLNDYYINMGANPRKMEGRYIHEIIGEDALKTLTPHFEKVLAGEIVNYEYEGLMADGKHHYFNVALAPEFSESWRCGWFLYMFHRYDHQGFSRARSKTHTGQIRIIIAQFWRCILLP